MWEPDFRTLSCSCYEKFHFDNQDHLMKNNMLRLWLLKCCKNKTSYDMKIYVHSIKIILYLIKHIFIISPFFHDIKIYFHSIKTNMYSIKYIFIISPFFHDIKIYFHSVKTNLYSVRNIFIIYIFFIQVKYIFNIWIFHWILCWWAYLAFQLYLQKSELYFQYVNWTTAQRCEY